jgi:hypothetical protein
MILTRMMIAILRKAACDVVNRNQDSVALDAVEDPIVRESAKQPTGVSIKYIA